MRRLECNNMQQYYNKPSNTKYKTATNQWRTPQPTWLSSHQLLNISTVTFSWEAAVDVGMAVEAWACRKHVSDGGVHCATVTRVVIAVVAMETVQVLVEGGEAVG